jgi:hypothetical protein
VTVRVYDVRLPPKQVADGDQDEEFLRAHQLAGAVLGLAGAWGALMTHRERLARRQRRCAYGATAGCAAIGAFVAWRPRVLARTQRRITPVVPPAAGLAAVALTRPGSSPMYLSSLVLTGIGTSSLDRRSGRRLGQLTGLAYLALVTVFERAWDRRLLWNGGMWTAYAVAGVIGAEVGRLALDVRTLERARQRDERLLWQSREVKTDLDRAAGDASRVAAELERVLLDIAGRRTHGEDEPAVLESIAKIRRPVHHVEMAEQLISAARQESLDVAAAVEEMLESFEAPLRAAGARAQVSFALADRATFDARATLAVLVTLKRAVDNAILGPRPGQRRLHDNGLSTVEVTVAFVNGELRLTVTDDAGGVAPTMAEWGTGLSEAWNRCRQLGGDLDLLQAERGVRLVAWVVANPVDAPPPGALERTLTKRFDGVLDRLVRELNLATIFQGLACALTGPSPVACAAAACAIAVVAGEELRPAARRSRRLTVARLVIVGSIWPRGGRPASGWVGLKLTEDITRHGPAVTPMCVAVAALGLQAARVRRTVAPGRIVENVSFPVLCTCFGAALDWAHAHLAQIDAQQVNLRQRAEYIESLAPAIEAFHDYVSPLKQDGHWWRRLEDADRSELERLRRALTGPTAALRALIPTTDPLAEMQAHLAVRLAPVEISVSGRQPVLDETRELNRLLARARRVTELVGKSDDIVDDLLNRFPRSISGRSRLTRVHLHLEPHGDEHWELWVRPIGDMADSPAADTLLLHRSGRRTVSSFAALPPDQDSMHLLHIDAIARAAE